MTSKNGKTTKKKLFLIDGNGLAYRAFYAVSPMQTSSGIPVNAVAGFVDMVLRLLKTEKPTHVAVAFDKGIPTERLDAYQDYNAQRVDMPEDLAVQLPIIEDFVRALGVPVFRVHGHEADDCLGTLAHRAAKEDFEVLILSGDLGLLQLVGPNTRVLTTRRGISDMVIYDEKSVKKRFNLKPQQLADLRALAGDSSDNITGVPGIGEVTAKKLLSQHGSLEDLLRSLHQLPAKWRNPLSENKAQALEFKARASIRTDLELDIDWDKCLYSGVPVERVGEIYQRMELDKVLEALPKAGEPGVAAEEKPDTVYLVTGKKARTELASLAKSKAPLSILFLGAGKEMVGLAVAEGDAKAVIVPIGKGAKAVPLTEAFKILQPALEDPKRRKNVHNLRSFLMLEVSRGLDPGRHFFDVGVASHLLDSREGNPWLDEVARRYGLDIPGEGELLGHGSGYRKLSEVPLEELSDWAGRRVLGLARLAQRLEAHLEENDLAAQYYTVELPTVVVFSKLERDGVPLDKKGLSALGEAIDSQLAELKTRIYEAAGGNFDFDDPKELAEVLFDRMALAVSARPKNGALIGNDILTQIADQNPIGLMIRDHRELTSLRASFQLALTRFETPRHGWFQRSAQFPVTNSERLLWMGPAAVGGAVATFNRLLSEVEGLPNVELRKQLSSMLLKCLKTSKRNHMLLGFGYDQFQLRLAAHLSGESSLIGGFVKHDDVEAMLASQVSGGELLNGDRQDLVDSLLGSIGAHRLARRTGMSPEDASAAIQTYLARFYENYKGMEAYFQGELNKVKSRGWVSSITGRRRNLPEMSSRNSDIRDTAERIARNAAIQSSAADILKKVLVEIDRELQTEKLNASMVMQLRDFVILEVAKEDVEDVADRVERLMHKAFGLDVPLQITICQGKAWSDCKELKRAALRR